jgi:hypothetical protein
VSASEGDGACAFGAGAGAVAVADPDAVAVVAAAPPDASTHDAKERCANLVELRKHRRIDVLDVSECDGNIEASARLSR